MHCNTFEHDKPYILSKFKNPVFDEATGLDNDTIKKNLMALADEMEGEPHPLVKARAFEYITRNVRIDVSRHDWFVGFGCWDRHDRLTSSLLCRWQHDVFEKYDEMRKLYEQQVNSGALEMWPDFDHSVPDWDVVFELGFPGLRKRAAEYRKKKELAGELTEAGRAFYEGIDITYGAILEMLERFRRFALDHGDGNARVLSVADSLKSLIEGAPKNTYEVLHLIYLFFIFGEHIDHMQVRSLGNLDRTLYPYYRRDIENGTYTEAQIREFISYFLMQYASINNYWGHPFYFGGTKKNGDSEINELSYLILDEFDKLSICSPKLQLKISPNTPVEFLNKALDMIRRGNSSIVLVAEPSLRRAMMGIGFTEEEARTCDISGCYEFEARAKEVKTAPVYLNLLKPIELVLNNGVDPVSGIECGCGTGDIESIRSFDDFYSAYIRQLDHIIECGFRCADTFEKHLQDINPAQVFSATIENSLKVARDAFADGSVYNNTVVLHTGLGTAVDSLMAVKEFVFEKHLVSLPELKKILADNWAGHEKLRLKMLRSRNKFGNGLESPDSYAEAIAMYCANKINMRPNVRGGFYKAAMHSARTFITFGKKTGATPDGRMAGDEMSKNMSATMGMDISGPTALLKSATCIDPAIFPGDFCVDMMLHPSAVRGEDGLAAMRDLFMAYMDMHGIAMNVNVLSTDTLLDAQKQPEKHEGLQIRVCGWNVRFNDICRKEQDAYIERAMNIRQ